jgi:hypothetical protein
MQQRRVSRLDRRRWLLDGVTFLCCLGVLALAWLPWFVEPKQPQSWYVNEGVFTTLLQVVPATVVAIFIFAVGAIFVMVQIIAPRARLPGDRKSTHKTYLATSGSFLGRLR